jgi:hypothetical protein
MNEEHTTTGALVHSPEDLEDVAASVERQPVSSAIATLAAQTEETTAFVTAYVEAARHLPLVDAVYADASEGFRVFTIYHGDDRAPIYEAEGTALDAVPSIRVRFVLLDGSRGDNALPGSARRIFWRG